MKKGRWVVRMVVKGLLMFVVMIGIGGVVVMLIWNALIPDLFRGPVLGFWQAAGLLILSHLLLRGWGGRWHGRGWMHERWRVKLEQKLDAMTPEERERFRAEWRGRCGWGQEDPTKKKESA